VVNLIGDPGFQLVSPAVRFGHDALHMVLNIWALPMPDLRQTGDCEARDADAPHGPDACTERSGGCVIPADRERFAGPAVSRGGVTACAMPLTERGEGPL
jgi:hypothetical protein